MKATIPVDEFMVLLVAALTLEEASGNIIRGSESIDIDISYEPNREPVAMGDWAIGPASDLVHALLNAYALIAPRDAGEERQPGYVRFSRPLPKKPTGHEVLAAMTLLTGQLRQIGVTEDRIATLLEMDDGFWPIPF